MKPCPLTKQQIVVLQLLANGGQMMNITHDLGINKVTLYRHLANIRAVTGHHNTMGLVADALRWGWIK